MPEYQRKPFLAFDLGAETGRAVLAHINSGVITTEEVHRFANEPVQYAGALPLQGFSAGSYTLKVTATTGAGFDSRQASFTVAE